MTTLKDLGLVTVSVTSFDWKQLPKHAADYVTNYIGDLIAVPGDIIDATVVAVDLRLGKNDSVVITLSNGKHVCNDDVSLLDEDDIDNSLLEGWYVR